MDEKPSSEPNEAYGMFCGPINQDTTRNLINRLGMATLEQKPITHFHLLFQSSGGTISEGICLYNVFDSFPIPLTIYNCGGVSSIATIAYLGAKIRKVNQFAAFMIHRTTCIPRVVTAEGARSMAKGLDIDDQRTGDILKKHLTIPDFDWNNLGNSEYWFSAAHAVTSGIAMQIGDFAPPLGRKVAAMNIV